MGLETAISNVKNIIKSKRMIQNYPNDLLAGNFSRTPLYTFIDNVVFDVEDEKVLQAGLNTFLVTACGFSFAYLIGHSMIADSFGDFYKKHSKIIDNTYSTLLTFGMGMGVNLAAGYDMKQSLISSSIRATTSLPLGSATKYFTNAFRDIRDEPLMIGDQHTSFKDKPLKVKDIPKLFAITALPLAIFFGTPYVTPDKEKTSNLNQTSSVYVEKQNILEEINNN